MAHDAEILPDGECEDERRAYQVDQIVGYQHYAEYDDNHCHPDKWRINCNTVIGLFGLQAHEQRYENCLVEPCEADHELRCHDV